MQTSLRASLRRLVLAAGLMPALTALGQTEASPSLVPPTEASMVTLDRLVISAARTPQDLRSTASAVSLLSLTDLAEAQITSLREALAQQPGVILINNGGVGSQSTILLRGTSSHQTLFIVDGVRMNDRTASFQNFLGGADLGGIERIEVLRGPQSTLYGSSAMGGVILIDTMRGTGPLMEQMSVTAGSFASYGASLSTTGAQGSLGYSGSLGYFQTDNDRPLNADAGWFGSTRLEYTVTPDVVIGLTFRAQKSDYDEPGSRLFLSPGSVEFANYLTTVYAQARAADSLTSRLTLGSHVRDYTYTSSYGSSPVKSARKVLDWQNTWDASSQAQVVAGVNYEESRYTVSGARTSDRLAATYLSATIRATKNLTFSGGGRYDEYRSAGGATTGRVGVAYVPTTGTKVRATYGTGFSAPGSDDVFGVPSYGQLPNPSLKPEKSNGWDVGVDQDLLGGRAQLGLTYFKNKFRNLFEYEIVDFTTYEGRTVNRARANTEGAELATNLRLSQRVKVRANYTYLEAHNDVSRARLIRRPRHTGDAEVRYEATKAWCIGAGAHFVADRLEGAAPIEDYTKARVFVTYTGADGLHANLRVENALDESYEEVLGYPALPIGVYGSIEWRF
jgi:vitamin B12 transporter